ncbi:MAG: BolA/IbaG family iron-sulfur metabolism protein [Oligoflexia bacterium]|nr:BolA/IbaG family iron-sulfur metabolism protein [Oligoflexia bacterium]
MTPKDIENVILQKLPDAKAFVIDLTGTQDHYQLVVVSPIFEGKKMIDQHRLVKALFDADIQSGELHALSLKTYTPQEWSRRKQ